MQWTRIKEGISQAAKEHIIIWILIIMAIIPSPIYPGIINPLYQNIPADTLQVYGIVPWWIQIMMGRLTKAFREKNKQAILKNAAELGHYIADAHVPLHVMFQS